MPPTGQYGTRSTAGILQHNKRNWLNVEQNTIRFNRLLTAYNLKRMEKGRLNKDDFREIGLIYRNDLTMPDVTARRILTTPEVKPLINSNLQLILLEKGISEDFVISERKDILKQAKENKQFSAALKALEGLENHLGINQKITVTETRQINSNLEDNYNKAKQTQTITISKNIDNEEKTRININMDSENSVNSKDSDNE